jgi:hypothetical protein
MLPLFLYGCETWPLTLKEEYKVGVFGNVVLRRIRGGLISLWLYEENNTLRD